MNGTGGGAQDLKLEHEWSIYYDLVVQKDRTSSSSGGWNTQQSKIGTFRTIGGFWSFFNNLAVPSRLPLEGTYSFFKSNIRPAWEDEHNSQGGEVRLFFNKTSTSSIDQAWSNVLLAAVGETLLESEETVVCGVTVCRKKTKCKIAIWIDKSSVEARQELEDATRLVVGSEVLKREGLVLEWTSHRQLLEKEKLKTSTSGSGSGRHSMLKRNHARGVRPPSVNGEKSVPH